MTMRKNYIKLLTANSDIVLDDLYAEIDFLELSKTTFNFSSSFTTFTKVVKDASKGMKIISYFA